ncbi:putative pentatricopeptide repeat-containing protein At3g01580 [Selaginella moellendorffii]|uniref:putative pentatricopeptide repeat-containing protein At3g01580 n=1 Tax=Selaginella moellendorffii TaxID=88036 RepID=UPI000D1C8ED0|nr:putative pentatricopeptide repeat-containing protein At3g01580 [Selaginella moellendorffii]|eukprot:XP_024541001.1 putative pentatricopeptide repeat-containing protein At3g01580 [Selaginella moellendorffii]
MDFSINKVLPHSPAWRGKSVLFDKKVEVTREEPLDFSTAWKQEAFRMHLRCGGIDQAEKLFSKLHTQDVMQYTLLISALVREGRFHDAVGWFQRMLLEGRKPDRVCFVAVVGAYGGIGDLDKAKFIHGYLYRSGYEADIIVGTALVNLYAKCGSFRNARLMFGRITSSSTVLWNAMITAYTQSRYVELYCGEVVSLFQRMCLQGIRANQVTFVAVLNACVGPSMAEEVERIHGLVTESGFQGELLVQTALIKAYGRAKLAGIATRIFEGIVERDIVAWNTMVAAYEAAGHFREAVHTFWQMRAESRVTPNRISFAAVLRACAGLQDLRQTERVHGLTMELGMAGDEEVQASLVDAYLACGSPSGALGIFGSMVSRPPRSWRSALRAAGDVVVFRLMMLDQGSAAVDGVTLGAALGFCETRADVELVRACAKEAGLDLDEERAW